MERITPTQIQAWGYENQAILHDKAGETIIAKYYRNEARGLRHEEIHQEIERLFEYSDAQNAVIDVGLHLAQQGKTVPVFEYSGQRDLGDEA